MGVEFRAGFGVHAGAGNGVVEKAMHIQRVLAAVFSSFAEAVVGFALLVSSANGQSCKAIDGDQERVADTVRTLYAGATVDDLAKVHSVTGSGFYAFDGGIEYSSIDALMTVVKGYQDQGVKFVWSVTKPKVTIHCDQAWISYVNDGSIQMPNGAPVPTQWLESVVLERQGGAWKIVFFHSTRVAAKAAQ